MTSDDTTVTRETRAEVLLRGGSQRLSHEACREFAKFEQARQALLENRKFSDDYKKQELAALEGGIDRQLWNIEAADLEKDRKTLDQEDGQINAQMKGNRHTAESQDPAAQAWALRQDLATLADQALARELADPAALADLFAESLASERPERIRRICPLIVQRVQAMAIGSSDNIVRATARTLSAEYSAWTARNPTLISRKRDVKDRRDRLEAANRERHRLTREKLMFRS